MQGQTQPDMNYYAAPRSRPGFWVSLILSLLLFAALLFCLWLIWVAGEEYRAGATRIKSQTLILEQTRDKLREILTLSPCEAKARLEGETPVSAREAPASSALSIPAAGVENVAITPEDVERACVFLASIDAGRHLNTGTGFYVAPGYVLTAKHVVEGADGKVLVTSKAMGKPARGSVVARGAGQGDDFALVRLDEPAAGVVPLPFAPGVKKTEKVGSWGFPDVVGQNDPKYLRLIEDDDLTATPEISYSEGVVSAILDRDPKLIIHTAPISTGNSGGPLVNQAGEVVGLNSMIRLDDDSYRQASIAIDGEDLKKFLREQGIENKTL